MSRHCKLPPTGLVPRSFKSSSTTGHIHKIFERSYEIGLWRLTANRISELFGVRLHKRLGGKLGTVIDQIEHGHHVFRACWKNAFLKQYEKFCTSNSTSWPSICSSAFPSRTNPTVS